VSGDLTSLQF